MREALTSSSSFIPKLSIYRSSGSYPVVQLSTDHGVMSDRPNRLAGSSSEANASTFNRYNNSSSYHDTQNTSDSFHTYNAHTSNTVNDMSGVRDASSPKPYNHNGSNNNGNSNNYDHNDYDHKYNGKSKYDHKSNGHKNSGSGPIAFADCTRARRPPFARSPERRAAGPPAPPPPPAPSASSAPSAPSASLPSSASPSLRSSPPPSRDGSSLLDLDAEALVPAEVLGDVQTHAYAWAQHPRHPIVLGLLRARGMTVERHVDVVEYHMSETFLNYIGLCCQGAYFVRYQVKRSPHERFFSIRMLPREINVRVSEKIPYIAWTMHREGVQIVGCLPLCNLVGVTVNARSAAFRTHLASERFIYGTRAGSHRVKLPINGALSLWFFDHQTRTASSLDLLTCNPAVLDVWANTFKGIASVNSSSVMHIPLTNKGMSVEMEKLSQEVQQQLSSGSS